jgi:alkylation response protein AidB-like acyl-CoA dehydrogenase
MTISLERHSRLAPDRKDYQAIAAEVAHTLTQTVQARDAQAGVPADEIQCLRQGGLLPLIVPQKYGGLGATWPQAMAVVKTLAERDSSAAQLYSYHLLLSATPQVSGNAAQAERYYRETAGDHLFWANAINVRDLRLTLEPDGSQFRASGVKSFCTGAVVADRIICAAIQTGNPLPVLFVLPSDRPGLSYNYDWQALGQRRTASGSFTFEQVQVLPEEILGPPTCPEGAFATFLGVIGMAALTYTLLGIAAGALQAAQGYTRSQTRPWLTAGVDHASQDPYILRRYGDLWGQLQGAIATADQATAQMQQAWEQGDDLTHSQRGEVAIAVATAKTLATQVGLAITSEMFELMGARSTATAYGFDRYWRNLRTLTLHDPLDYKLREIGDWVLNGNAPQATPYA